MPELQDIFREFGREFRTANRLPLRHLKAMRAIETCRTAELGGHLDQCEECGHLRISYNSCRNRHCPKCQGAAGEKWLADRMDDLLPVRYFHVVFTLPDMLNPLALRNQREVYGLLFRAASETLLELAADPKFLGARIGLTAVLHTWGQNLMDHPHPHCLVPGGGISPDSLYWRQSRKKFFIPVRVISRKFRGKFLALLMEAYRDGKLVFTGAIAGMAANVEQPDTADESQALPAVDRLEVLANRRCLSQEDANRSLALSTVRPRKDDRGAMVRFKKPVAAVPWQNRIA